MHVVTTPGEVDSTLDLVLFWKPFHDMPYRFPTFDDSGDGYVVYGAEVVRLPSGIRIEVGLFEPDGRAIGGFKTLDDGAFELVEIWIRKIEPFGHGAILAGIGKVTCLKMNPRTRRS